MLSGSIYLTVLKQTVEKEDRLVVVSGYRGRRKGGGCSYNWGREGGV